MIPTGTCSFLVIKMCQKEELEQIDNLKSSKSSSPDGILESFEGA